VVADRALVDTPEGAETRVGDLQGRADGAVAALERAAETLEETRQRVDAIGQEELDRLADAHERAETMLERYGEDAVGTGDFEAYLSLQDEFATLVGGLPDECRHRDAFEAALDALDRRRLRPTDLEQVREELEPVADCVERLDALADARMEYESARRDANAVQDDLATAIDHFESLADLTDIDLGAPVEELRDPIGDYDERIRDAVQTLLHEAPSREVCDLFVTAANRPLLEVEAPPATLRSYLRDDVAGGEPVVALLDLADQSQAKRAHSVDDPAAFATAVEPARPYLERIDAGPFTVGWPPPPADRLRWWCREAIPVVGRFADAETVRRLRSIRDRTRDPEFDRLRDAAVAREDLDAADRERIADGVADDLATLRSAHERVTGALEEHPPLDR
jgi:hypothetical protein